MKSRMPELSHSSLLPPPASLTATYRLQLSPDFPLPAATEVVPYLSRLGVSHAYCSPLLQARPGSHHGYDVVDPARLNPELGTTADLHEFVATLRRHDMGMILDIVPNHMATGRWNPYWMDVLTHGERSRYAAWFDIDWDAEPRRRVILPLLGDALDQVIARGELRVEATADDVRLAYFDHRFPIDPDSLTPALQLARWDPAAREDATESVSGAAGAAVLRAMLDAQHYRLEHWRTGVQQINYRRFFDVPDLVGIRVEDPDVFAQTHALIFDWVRAELVDGLRVDHIDGLLDPAGYLARLRNEVNARARRHLPIVVEKILAGDEELRRDWPVEGTSGYEFLNDIEDLFLDPGGFARLDRAYRRLRRQESVTFSEIARDGKLRVLAGPLASDVRRLGRALTTLARAAGVGSEWTVSDVDMGIAQFIASLPVYRTYLSPAQPAAAEDRSIIEKAATDAIGRAGSRRWGCVARFIGDALLDITADGGDARTDFALRFQQTSGPATAKGVEDTALYVYIPLVSRNEVGGAPDRPLEHSVARFHRRNATRSAVAPQSLLCTNTHDTKRSADLRARLDVLTEIPLEWHRSVARWRRLNHKHRTLVRGRLAPDTNTEHLLYQVLVGLWPAPRPGRRSDDLPDRAWLDTMRGRLQRYAVKAMREAKLRTSWIDPDVDFENGTASFIEAILEPGDHAPFLTDVSRLVSRIAPAAHWNSLARLALHLTSPGTPDLYQGDEMWNISLVDPDNRRPVDYDVHTRALDSLGAPSGDSWRSLPKLHVTNALLSARRTQPELFTRGDYHALAVAGSLAGHVVAFSRSAGSHVAITVATRLSTALAREAAPDGAHWGDCAVIPPSSVAGRQLRDAITGRQIRISSPARIGDLLLENPVAVWIANGR
jgi:(1->4)-alpha-D-glucan 1-alpha-D-glucosylmutase